MTLKEAIVQSRKHNRIVLIRRKELEWFDVSIVLLLHCDRFYSLEDEAHLSEQFYLRASDMIADDWEYAAITWKKDGDDV